MIAPNHTAAYDSVAASLPGAKAELRRDEQCLARLALQILRGRNPRHAVEALGLREHPTVKCATRKERHNWHPIYANMLYRDDPSTAFKSQSHVLHRAETHEDNDEPFDDPGGSCGG